MEALDAAAVEEALSLCEEADSGSHPLPGPWETQTQDSEPGSPVLGPLQGSEQEPPGPAVAPAVSPGPARAETPVPPEPAGDQQLPAGREGPEAAGNDEVTSSMASDDCTMGGEAGDGEGPGGEKEEPEVVVKSEGEEWSQQEVNPPCLGKSAHTHTHTHTHAASGFIVRLKSPPLSTPTSLILAVSVVRWEWVNPAVVSAWYWVLSTSVLYRHRYIFVHLLTNGLM